MPPPAAATGGGAAAGRSVVPSATVMVVAVLLVRPSLHPASSSVAVPAKTVARAAPARRRVSTAAAAAAAVFHPDNWLSGHVYPAALPLSWVGRSETAELAQVGIMFFSAAQTPPSHHSLALPLSRSIPHCLPYFPSFAPSL